MTMLFFFIGCEKVTEESVKTMNDAASITFLAVDDDTLMKLRVLREIVYLNTLYEEFNPLSRGKHPWLVSILIPIFC